MINIEVVGEVKEIIYQSETSFIFLVTKGTRRILATLTTRYLDLSKYIKVGESYRFLGNLNAYVKEKNNERFIDNVFYVSSLISLSNIENIKG